MFVLGIAPLLTTLLVCLAPPGELASEADTQEADTQDERGAPAAEAEVLAQHLETKGALVPAAEAWETVLANAIDADTRGHAAFRAQKAYREAARSSGQQDLLCEAQRVVATHLERGDLGEDERHDFDGFRELIETALSEADTTCDEARLAHFLEVEVSRRAVEGEKLAAGGSPQNIPERAVDDELEARSRALVRSRAQVAPKKVAGGVLLGAGVALLGAATYGIIEDYRAAQAIIVFAPKNNTVGLTEAEIAALRAEQERARLGSRLAIGAGVSAGAALITGAVLLALPSTSRRKPKERRSLALQPSLGPLHAGLRLRGSF